MTEGPAYRALALQARCRSVNRLSDPTEARARIKATIERLREQIAASVGFIGPDCRLVVLPEYVLTGHPVGDAPADWAERAAVDPEGPEVAALASVAADRGIYLVANLYERDPAFPALYFQSCLIFGPGGDTILRYRRLNSLFTPTPFDVWDQYLDRYGIDGVFPVARTEIGALACVASDEILFPEVARCLAVRGAEVLCHPTSEASSPTPTIKHIARRARAAENLAYVVSANTGGIEGSPIPGDSTDGGSQIVDFEGGVKVTSGPGETMTAYAEIDLAALRRARRRPGMTNLPARNRFALYASTYRDAIAAEPNGLASGVAPERAYFLESQRAAIARMLDDGVIA